MDIKKRAAKNHKSMRWTGAALLLPLLLPQTAEGVVIRDDKADALYTGLAGQAQFASVGRVGLARGATCSGTLIKANAVLTAAHCLTGQTPGTVTFTVGGNTYQAEHLISYPGWTGDLNAGNDVGVIRLKTPVNNVTPAKRYTETNEVGQTATVVGFGQTGDGTTGAMVSTSGTKRAFQNVIDGTASSVPSRLDPIRSSRVLLTDFDNPGNVNDSSMGANAPLNLEGQVAPGDSGGGWFIGGEVAGVSSFRDAPNFYNMANPDTSANSDYGDISGATRVSSFPDFIDTAVAQSFILPGPGLPTPIEVFGKEYSDRPDKNAANLADPEQNLAWDGLGNVADTFDYSGSRFFDLEDRQVDALANGVDALFNQVVADQVFLLFSTENDPNIYYEMPGAPVGGIWATPAQINAQGVADVDALEVWGPDGASQDDASAYSLEDDPGGVSVYTYDANTNVSIPYLTTLQIAAAIGRTDLADSIELDAMMMFDWTPDMSVFDAGDRLLFSIAPIDIFDGGEIWIWNGIGLAEFLFHGGHLWDTAFDVMGTFGTISENINALEAVATRVPEPGSLLLLAFGLFFLLRWISRSRPRPL